MSKEVCLYLTHEDSTVYDVSGPSDSESEPAFPGSGVPKYETSCKDY